MPEPVTFEHYEVLTREDGSLHELGRGAMGITYKGFDTRLRVPVALKVINATHLNSETARQRFVREARSAARLRHRNVASVFHLGEEGGDYFYAMEFIDGETVEALVKRQGPLAPALALRIAAQVARALNAAQKHELVHRDIKPSNMMVVHEDEDLVVKVIDFGLAKVSFAGEAGASAESLTMGGFLGTPHFASPEQLEEREIDVRSDIYSLGVTLWYLLTGKTPFSGSVARVVNQHLSKEPPFEELTGVPEPVAQLLRKMLAKDPAERPQKPAELRKEIEHCLGLLGESAGVAIASLSGLPNASQPTSVPDETRFETGATIAGRYLIAEQVADSEAGNNFRARDLQNDREVQLLVLHRELLHDSGTAAQIEREARQLATLSHPNLLKVFGLEVRGRVTFLTLEWVEGFSLLELLRARRELPLEEVIHFLPAAAAGLDHALAAGIERLDLALHHVLIHFPSQESARDALLHESVDLWPEHVVKINPLATWRSLVSLTGAAGQTVVRGLERHADTLMHGRVGAIQSFGAVIYELLGGVPTASSSRHYTPLAALSEATNSVLRRAILTPESFKSAAEFVQLFASTPEVKTPPRERAESSASQGRAPAPTPPVKFAPPEPPPPARTPPASAAVSAPPPRRGGRSPAGLIAGIVVALAAVVALAYFIRPRPQPIPPLPTPSPTVRPQTPAPTPVQLTPSPTPRATIPPPTPTPPPTRRDLAVAARRAAEALEAKQASREALSAWLRLSRDYPEFDIGKVGIELLLNRLQRRPGGLTREEFTKMRPEIEEAARLDTLAAMMILGEELRQSDPATSFAWYCAAAEKGEPLAMTQAGLMLSSGNGTKTDLQKAFSYLTAASDKDEPNATAALAECYLFGLGTEKNEKQAIVLLKKASNEGNVRAKNRLGVSYHKGIGVPRNDREAFRLFSEAAERGSAEAIGNLGVLYMNGDGVAKDPVKAAEKLKEASLKGDVGSMYYYGICLEKGLGTKANSAGAANWLQKAAEAGQAEAAEWCKSHGVPFKASR